MIVETRYFIFILVCLAAGSALLASALWGPAWLVPAAVLVPLVFVGIHDLRQKKHSILRNYPVIGHVRFLMESIRPEIRQYLLEGDQEEVPFSRQVRALVYQRAKGVEDKRPFGTIENVYGAG